MEHELGVRGVVGVEGLERDGHALRATVLDARERERTLGRHRHFSRLGDEDGVPVGRQESGRSRGESRYILVAGAVGCGRLGRNVVNRESHLRALAGASIVGVVAACGGSGAPQEDAGAAPVDASGADAAVQDAGGTADSGTPLPGKRVLWGDLHVHTSFFFDAYTFNNINGPREAFAFASGDALGYPCGDDPGQSCYEQRLSLPLDFVALTEHAEYLGVAPACGADGSVENPAF